MNRIKVYIDHAVMADGPGHPFAHDLPRELSINVHLMLPDNLQLKFDHEFMEKALEHFFNHPLFEEQYQKYREEKGCYIPPPKNPLLNMPCT